MIEYPIPKRLNTLLTAGYMVTTLALLFAASRAWEGQHHGLFLASMASFVLLFNSGFALVHEAEHFMLHPSRNLNESLGCLLGFLFPASFSLLRAAHLVHHGNNRGDRELIEYVKPGESRRLKTTQYFLCMFGAFWFATPVVSLLLCILPGQYFSAQGKETYSGSLWGFLAFLEDMDPVRLRLEVFAGVLFWTAAAVLLELSATPVVLLYIVAGCFWSSQQFIYHVGTPRHVIEGTRNLAMSRPFEWIYLNYNHHLTHHRQPHVPWTHLPNLTSPQPGRGYWRTWLWLFTQPPVSIVHAWPQHLQLRGSLPPRTG